MLYTSIGGSRAYGVHVEHSDIDIFQIVPDGTAARNTLIGDCNLITVELSTFTGYIHMENVQRACQWLFPQYFITANGFTAYILDHREDVIKANLTRLYDGFVSRACGLELHAGRLYQGYPKRMCYSILFRSILANYAEGMTFARAHRPEGELHDFLTGMRLGQVPLEDAVARNEQERLRAEKAAGFYRKDVHPEILRDFEQVIREEAEKERRNPHA